MNLKGDVSKYDWWFLAALAIISIGLGMHGFHAYALPATHVELTLPDLLYRSLQLFTFESGAVAPPLPLTLEIARWLAPAATFFAILKSILFLLRRRGQTLFRMRSLGQHVIVCGLGSKGLHIARAFMKRGSRVVIIETNDQHIHLSELERQGAIIINGDARDQKMLERSRIAGARYLFALTDCDASNIIIVQKAHELISTLPGGNQALDCYAHVADSATKTLFYNHPLFSDSSRRFNAQLFNLFDRAARLLFEQYAPDSSRSVRSQDDPAVSILIFGFSPLATSLILHAARNGHYANNKKLKITVVDQQASSRIRSLSLSTPALDDVIDILGHDLSLESLTTTQILSFIEAGPDTLFVCAPDDTLAIALSLRLQPLAADSPAPIVTGLLETSALTRLLCETGTGGREKIHLFPLIRNTLSLERVLNSAQDEAARLIHEMYCEDQFSQGETVATNPSLVPWDALTEDMKDSNRGQADHVPVKLRAISQTLEAAMANPDGLTFTPEQVRLLSEMEHRRWMADKRLNGWRLTQGGKDNKLKLNPLLVDYDKLPENERHKDEQTIVTLPRLLELMKSHRTAENP